MDRIDSVCVFGAGTLGWQIALQCASHAFPVYLYDLSSEALVRAHSNITNELDKWVQIGEISTEVKESTLQRLVIEADPVKAVEGVDLVIEAVPEKLELKRRVFKELDAVCGADTIISTNSSSIRVSLIEDATGRMDRVLNTHFYSNPWRSQIVELMKGSQTSDETIDLRRGLHEVNRHAPS